MPAYTKLKDGEWIRPSRKAFKDMCCDCGLVHTVDFRIVEDGNRHFIEFRARRHGPATGGARKNRLSQNGTMIKLP